MAEAGKVEDWAKQAQNRQESLEDDGSGRDMWRPLGDFDGCSAVRLNGPNKTYWRLVRDSWTLAARFPGDPTRHKKNPPGGTHEYDSLSVWPRGQ